MGIGKQSKTLNKSQIEFIYPNNEGFEDLEMELKTKLIDKFYMASYKNENAVFKN